MPLHGFSLRLRALAIWLSLLALCSALVAPASVLAQELRSGQWIALCGSSAAGQAEGHASGDGGHCDLCALPGLALLPVGQQWPGLAPDAIAGVPGVTGQPAAAPQQPAIRGPPFLS